MNLRPQKSKDVDVNMTPLIDVVFLMLIFFMVSTTFDRESRIQIELPESSKSEAPAAQQEPIKIAVDAQGHLYLNDQELVNSDFKTLKLALQQRIRGVRKLPPVSIMADAKAPHGAVMIAMDAAGQVGLVNFSFEAKERREDK